MIVVVVVVVVAVVSAVAVTQLLSQHRLTLERSQRNGHLALTSCPRMRPSPSVLAKEDLVCKFR